MRVTFDPARATAEIIREEDDYSGIRVALGGTLSRAAVRFHVDVNAGDPIWPEPQRVDLPRLLASVLQVSGYHLNWCSRRKSQQRLPEARPARGGATLDVYVLVTRHPVSGATFRASLHRVAQYRQLALAPMASVLEGYAEVAQAQWAAWLRKQRLESTMPSEFVAVLDYLVAFVDPIISSKVTDLGTWDPKQYRWQDS